MEIKKQKLILHQETLKYLTRRTMKANDSPPPTPGPPCTMGICSPTETPNSQICNPQTGS
jgi:hypothetical protein